jgi:hypothetical protein
VSKASGVKRETIRDLKICIGGIVLLCALAVVGLAGFRAYRESCYDHSPSAFYAAALTLKPGATLSEAKAIMLPLSTEIRETSGSATFALRPRSGKFFPVSHFANLKMDANGVVLHVSCNDG